MACASAALLRPSSFGVTLFPSFALEYALLRLSVHSLLCYQDCRDDDPMTRGLALRSFTSLRLPNIVEYLPAAIQVIMEQRLASRKASSASLRRHAIAKAPYAARLTDLC
eukprot:scaffold161396_cov30-Tisochrysis_lutea.AAC.2